MNNAVEPPLNAHLLFPSQTESIQAEARADVGKHGFHRCHSSSVDQLTCYRIDLLPHLLREGLGLLFGLSGKVGELASFGLIGFLQALRPELARDAISLGSLELDGVSSIMDQVAVPVHAFACRADAECLVGADREVTRLEDDGPTESFGDLFIESLLVSIRFGKPGIAVTELVVRYYCVNASSITICTFFSSADNFE
jgi:hypothetical protein